MPVNNVQKYKNALKAVLAVRAHKLAELALHIAALIMLFHTAEYAPQEQHPNAETYSIQQQRGFGIQGAHKRAGGNKTGKYQINKRFHYSK